MTKRVILVISLPDHISLHKFFLVYTQNMGSSEYNEPYVTLFTHTLMYEETHVESVTLLEAKHGVFWLSLCTC